MLYLRSNVGDAGTLPKCLQRHFQLPLLGKEIDEVLPLRKQEQPEKLRAEIRTSNEIYVNNDTVLDSETLGTNPSRSIQWLTLIVPKRVD